MSSRSNGVTKVEFYIDSVLKGTDTSAPYSYSWDTTAYPNGSHTIFSKAYDAAGNVGTSTTITVTVASATQASRSVAGGCGRWGVPPARRPWTTAARHSNVFRMSLSLPVRIV